MKPKSDTYRIVFFTMILLALFAAVCILFPSAVRAQSIGTGMGKTSDGRTTVKLCFSTPSGFGAYACHYADDYWYDCNETTEGFLSTENKATMMGITGRIHQLVTVYIGAGAWNKTDSYNDKYGYRYYKMYKGKCAEIGAQMELARVNRISFTLDGSFNTTMQVNTMLLIHINL